jgi:hypothetical protein
MSIFGNLYNAYTGLVRIGQMSVENLQYAINRNFYTGNQKEQLKVGVGKTNDNVLANVIALNINRSVSHVLTGGVQFDLGEGRDEEQQYIDNLYEVNQKMTLFVDSIIDASVYNTGYIKFSEGGMIDPYTGKEYPRLIAINPEWMTIETDDQDMAKVESYVIQYTVVERDEEVTYRETTEKTEGSNTWTIRFERTTDKMLQTWQSIKPDEVWPYDFPPVVHWKNQPSLNSVYGFSDMEDVRLLQDKMNFGYSNLQKMVRLQAHKQMWGRGIKKEELVIGPDQMVMLTGNKEQSELGLLDFTADITGSLSYVKEIRQLIADLMREVDVTSILDKIGQLTNFAIHVLFKDSMDKNDVKRQLFGEALLELNRRLLVVSGKSGEQSRPGKIVWHDPLPSNRAEDIQADAALLSNGLVSKQTLSEKYGYDWEVEQERIAQEKGSQDNAIGAALLRSFPSIGKVQ